MSENNAMFLFSQPWIEEAHSAGKIIITLPKVNKVKPRAIRSSVIPTGISPVLDASSIVGARCCSSLEYSRRETLSPESRKRGYPA